VIRASIAVSALLLPAPATASGGFTDDTRPHHESDVTDLDDAREPGEGHVLLRAGASYRLVWDIPIVAGELGGCIGKWARGKSFHCGGASLLLGRTEAGLAVSGWTLGYRADWALGPLRLGIAPGIGGISFSRVTSGSSMKTGGPRVSLLAGVTLLDTDSGAIDLEAAFDACFYSAVIWGPTLALAARF
jgi:hypothetical protein